MPSKEEETAYEAAKKHLEEIKQLVDDGILGRELCPEPKYWHWQILDADRLPEKYRIFIELGEVRFYGDEEL